jgi:hypothetical protein
MERLFLVLIALALATEAHAQVALSPAEGELIAESGG